MYRPTSNRLLPVLGITLLTVVMLITQRACRDPGSEAVVLDQVPSVTAPDADTPEDTITTLTANVAAMTRELEQLEDSNARLRKDNADIIRQRDALEADLSTRIAAEIAQLRDQVVDNESEMAEAVDRRLDAVIETLAQLPSEAPAELPIGLGFDGPAVTDEIVWIEPLDADASELLPNLRPSLGSRSAEPESAMAMPRFTVPRNATLLGATAMTAMLGRVPIGGQVQDPMPFKVLTGNNNLAANGYSIPGVAGMVWTGTAIGDWSLSCVSGEVHSVTFVFEDGSIQTLSSDEASEQDDNTRRPLGWVSDARGIPCVTGARKSDAGFYLSQRLAAATVEAAADAAAAAQTNTVIRDTGAATTAVDGNLGAFVLGRSVADGGAEIADWLSERQAQSFDAVFVPAGTELVIHVDRELAIDLDPHARKLHYVSDGIPTDSQPYP